jgi:hypothetical protein
MRAAAVSATAVQQKSTATTATSPAHYRPRVTV